jgi:hypothetical protein
MRRARAAAAVAALAGLLMPGVAALAAASHLSAHRESDHDHADRGHDVDLSVVWHGHSHPAATPDHGHPFLLAGTHVLQVANPKVTPLRPHTPPTWPHAGPLGAAIEGQPSRRHPLLLGVGPPQLEPVSILRI